LCRVLARILILRGAHMTKYAFKYVVELPAALRRVVGTPAATFRIIPGDTFEDVEQARSAVLTEVKSCFGPGHQEAINVLWLLAKEVDHDPPVVVLAEHIAQINAGRAIDYWIKRLDECVGFGSGGGIHVTRQLLDEKIRWDSWLDYGSSHGAVAYVAFNDEQDTAHYYAMSPLWTCFQRQVDRIAERVSPRGAMTGKDAIEALLFAHFEAGPTGDGFDDGFDDTAFALLVQHGFEIERYIQ
jgi:hypothetical protein